jgi:hypothetical protein
MPEKEAGWYQRNTDSGVGQRPKALAVSDPQETCLDASPGYHAVLCLACAIFGGLLASLLGHWQQYQQGIPQVREYPSFRVWTMDRFPDSA